MKVILINTPESENSIPVVNYGLECLEAILQKNSHHVRIVDPIVEKIKLNFLGKTIFNQEKNVDVIGISALPSSLVTLTKILSSLKKYRKRNFIIVIGGYFATHYKENAFQILPKNSFDILVLGKGEHTLLDIIRFCSKEITLFDIPNIIFREKGTIVTNPRSPVSFKGLPWATRSMQRKLSESDKGILNKVNIFKSSGCLNFCSFCSIHDFISPIKSKGKESYLKSAWITRDVNDLVGEIKYLFQNYNTTDFDFVDDDVFGYKPDDWLEIADLLEKEQISDKINYYISCRVVDFVNYSNIIERMAETGLKIVFLGFESPNECDIKIYNKNFSINGKSFKFAKEYQDYIIIAKKIADQLGIRLKIGNILIHAESTLDSIRSALLFYKSNNLLYNLESIIKELAVYKHTTIEKYYKRKKYLLRYNIFDNWNTVIRYAYKKIDPEVRIFYRYIKKYYEAIWDIRIYMVRASRFKTYDEKYPYTILLLDTMKKMQDTEYQYCLRLIDSIKYNYSNKNKLTKGAIRQISEIFDSLKEKSASIKLDTGDTGFGYLSPKKRGMVPENRYLI